MATNDKTDSLPSSGKKVDGSGKKADDSIMTVEVQFKLHKKKKIRTCYLLLLLSSDSYYNYRCYIFRWR